MFVCLSSLDPFNIVTYCQKWPRLLRHIVYGIDLDVNIGRETMKRDN